MELRSRGNSVTAVVMTMNQSLVGQQEEEIVVVRCMFRQLLLIGAMPEVIGVNLSEAALLGLQDRYAK